MTIWTSIFPSFEVDRQRNGGGRGLLRVDPVTRFPYRTQDGSGYASLPRRRKQFEEVADSLRHTALDGDCSE